MTILKIVKRATLLIAFFVGCFSVSSLVHSGEWCAQEAWFSNAKQATHRLGEGLFVVETSDVIPLCLPGNVAVLTGHEGVLIVDTQYRHVNEGVVDAIKTLSNKRIRYLLNSHGHPDHTHSNSHYGHVEHSVIIAHKEAREYMRVDHNFSFKGEPVFLPAQQSAGLPQITFNTDMEVHFNNETIRLISVGPAHSAGDAVIHFVDSNAIHTGDLMQSGNLPYFDVDGDIQNLVDGYRNARKHNNSVG